MSSQLLSKMKIKLFLLGVLFVAQISCAQTALESSGFGSPNGFQPKPYVPPMSFEQAKTQFFNGHMLRRVNGKIYDATSWELFRGNVYEKLDDIVFIERKTIYGDSTFYVAVTNYPNDVLADQNVLVVAKRVGIYDMGGRPIEYYDCGTPYIPPPPTAAQIKAEQDAAKISTMREKQKQFLIESNVVIWLQSQVTNGDAESECDLGEHYLTGSGCETNRTKAVYWLTKAANQGDLEASNKLSNLK
jgi:Sel1 repeat